MEYLGYRLPIFQCHWAHKLKIGVLPTALMLFLINFIAIKLRR